MKNNLTTILITLIATFAMLGSANASQLPKPAMDVLQQREQRLNHLSSDWQLTLSQSVPAQPENAIFGMQQAVRKQLPRALDKNGITNEQTKHQMVEQEVNNVTHLMKGFSSSSVNMCTIVRDGDATLVTGTLQQRMTIRKILEFYSGSSGMIVNKSSMTISGRKAPVLFPVAWGTPGRSVDYREPFKYGFELLPEHFSTLAGINPLTMYGTPWDLISTTSDSWILTSQVKQGAFAPFSLKLTLDREHDGAPSLIEIVGEKSSATVKVLGFQRYKNDWIDKEVSVSSLVPGIKIRHEIWQLKSVQPSKHIVVSLSTKRPIADYHLLGNNLTVTDALFTTKQQAKRIVYYPWAGHFPTVDDLKKINHIQRPGEATPDVGQNGVGTPTSVASMIGSIMPFAGGLLLLTGGVWMFKQRKAN